MVGSLHWSFDSERYFGRKGGQIKKDRIVELAPVRVSEPADSAVAESGSQSLIKRGFAV